MSCKRRGNVIPEYVVKKEEEESSSEEEEEEEEERNDARYLDCDVSSSGRPALTSRQESVGSTCSSEPRRRGRGVSKRPCLSRNAQMARENRQRKKEYLENVENKLAFYRQENKNLSTVIQRQGIDLKRLKAEVTYLKSVLNNSSSITTLLKSMNETLASKNGSSEVNRVERMLRPRNDSGNSDSGEKTEERELLGRNYAGSRTTWQRGGKRVERPIRANSRVERPIRANSRVERPIRRANSRDAPYLKAQSLGDSDHTYTTSGDGSLDGKPINYEEIDALCSKDSGNFSEIDADRFIANLPATDSSMDFAISQDVDDELPQFDAQLFDSIGNDAIADSNEYLRNDSFNCEPGNLFENLDNSGICLHVNSGKISLEFCSICHLNSVNAE